MCSSDHTKKDQATKSERSGSERRERVQLGEVEAWG